MHRVHSSGRHVGTAVIKTLKRPFNSNILTFPVVQKAIYQEYDLQYLRILAFDSHSVSTFGGVFSILGCSILAIPKTFCTHRRRRLGEKMSPQPPSLSGRSLIDCGVALRVRHGIVR